MFCHTKEARAMIMTQEQAFLKAQTDLQTLVAFVRQAAEEEQRIDQVERHLLARLLRLGLVLLEGFVAEHGDGDQGEAVAGADGSRLRVYPKRMCGVISRSSANYRSGAMCMAVGKARRSSRFPWTRPWAFRLVTFPTWWKTGPSACACTSRSPRRWR